MYAKFFKRVFDFTLSLTALILLLPLLTVLTVVGAIAMGGNPFFTQERPGKNERIFRLVKFRTMSNKKDENGNLLPDGNTRSHLFNQRRRQTDLETNAYPTDVSYA